MNQINIAHQKNFIYSVEREAITSGSKHKQWDCTGYSVNLHGLDVR